MSKRRYHGPRYSGCARSTDPRVDIVHDVPMHWAGRGLVAAIVVVAAVAHFCCQDRPATVTAPVVAILVCGIAYVYVCALVLGGQHR